VNFLPVQIQGYQREPLPTSWLHSIHHDGLEKYVSNPEPHLGETVQVRLRLECHAPVREVYLRTAPDGEQSLTPMRRAANVPPVQWWVADLSINEPQVRYRFVVVADDGVWFLGAAGLSAYPPLAAADFCLLADYDPPAWVRESVFYQVFLDSFANGDATLDPTPDSFEYAGQRPCTFPWGESLPEDAPYTRSYYGGDLPGIAQHLDHLANLGVNALYLTPVFCSRSCHRYDVVDYDTVDPILGGDEALAALRVALDAQGMRYILDMVPNHCSIAHPWFLAAQADREATEFEFFLFTQHPDQYRYWTLARHLVLLNYQSAELRRRMYGRPDAPFRRWLQSPYAADGWRVDVGNMLGRQGAIQLNAEVIREIRAAVKAARPDAYLIGENFYDASAQLQGDQWDGVMNYDGFSRPLLHWLAGFTMGALGFKGTIASPVPFATTALEATWRTRRAAIPWLVALQQFNMLGSHDTQRIRSVLGGNDALQRLATIVQMTFPGVPCVYYGDEIGMVNTPGSPTSSGMSRGCMIWDEAHWNHDLLHFYRDIIALRRRAPVLHGGGFQVLLVGSDTLAYQREGVTSRILVIAHRGETPRPASNLPVAHGGIPDGACFVEHFSGREAVVADGALPLPAQPQGATLWESTP
jgi:alpha-glucosidase